MRSVGEEIKPRKRYVQTVTLGDEMKRSVTVFIFSGVLERFPRLKLVSAENEVSWLPFVIQRWDHAFEEYRHMYPTPLKLKPSEYFHRQVFATFFNDPLGVEDLPQVGVYNRMWCSAYPPTQPPRPPSHH